MYLPHCIFQRINSQLSNVFESMFSGHQLLISRCFVMDFMRQKRIQIGKFKTGTSKRYACMLLCVKEIVKVYCKIKMISIKLLKKR